MSKIHNFSAGPSILAESAFEKSIQDIKNFAGTGLSILEVSHRGKEFEKVILLGGDGTINHFVNNTFNYPIKQDIYLKRNNYFK